MIVRIFLMLIIGFFLICPYKGLCQESIYNLEQANSIADSSLKYAYAYNINEIKEYTKVYFPLEYQQGPWTKEKYIFYMEAFYYGYKNNKVTWRGLVNLVGSDGADTIYYILKHYDEWYFKFMNQEEHLFK